MFISGTCTCAPGYMGEFCDKKCPSGKFGSDCLYECSCKPGNTYSCDPATGKCICKSGWNGIYYY